MFLIQCEKLYPPTHSYNSIAGTSSSSRSTTFASTPPFAIAEDSVACLPLPVLRKRPLPPVAMVTLYT
ncbi:hypothetical protein CEXT_112981 [Caerostris extrusa]|uniref:Uncharacterized protein n=1 Tax=Caerostris extrusa TaxID=172846 RepID=A0AAV4QBJ8_CAEEX|nr:hypothetical protein CEXT_112981 [Caerostris extrusa]